MNNVSNISINNDNIICPIDLNILDNPVECEICNHNFCLKCYNERIEYLKKNNLEIKCAYCNKNKDGKWIVHENKFLKNLIKNLFKCKKCKKEFKNKEELNNHICKFIKCKICKETLNYENFINHIIIQHTEEFIRNFKVNNNNNNNNNNEYYDENSLPVKGDKYLASNGLYYCDKKTNLNCGCCSGIFSKGNCLCVDCMNYNKKIKKLNDIILINKAAKAAKYKKKYKSYYCNTKYTNEKICHYPNEPCFECQILTKLMKKYLKSEVYNFLIN